MIDYINELGEITDCSVVMLLNGKTRKIAKRLLKNSFKEVGVLENYLIFSNGTFSDAYLWYKVCK